MHQGLATGVQAEVMQQSVEWTRIELGRPNLVRVQVLGVEQCPRIPHSETRKFIIFKSIKIIKFVIFSLLCLFGKVFGHIDTHLHYNFSDPQLCLLFLYKLFGDLVPSAQIHGVAPSDQYVRP